MFNSNLSLQYSANSQHLGMFNTNPLQYDDDRFAYLIFPFNSAFMKSHNVKRLYYIVGKRTQNKCYYEFDKKWGAYKRY